MNGTKHQYLRKQLKVALATNTAANKVAAKAATAATKALATTSFKVALAASDRATNAFFAALGANRVANDALAALVHDASGITPPNVQ